MNIVEFEKDFDTRSECSGYTCSVLGDQSGEYVPLAEVKQLLEELKKYQDKYGILVDSGCVGNSNISQEDLDRALGYYDAMKQEEDESTEQVMTESVTAPKIIIGRKGQHWIYEE